jgi:hypothetical protein
MPFKFFLCHSVRGFNLEEKIRVILAGQTIDASLSSGFTLMNENIYLLLVKSFIGNLGSGIVSPLVHSDAGHRSQSMV